MRTKHLYNIKLTPSFKEKLLAWAKQYEHVVWLDSNNYQQQYGSYDAILAVDAFSILETSYKDAFKQLKTYQTQTKDWIFGYLTYDLKNDVENLESKNFDGLEFSDLCFFQPKKIFLFKNDTVEIQYLNPVFKDVAKDWSNINATKFKPCNTNCNAVKVKLRTSKEAYFNKVNNVLSRINRGDIYEANFCQEFYANNTTINPLDTYLKLNNISKPPFATFLKVKDKFLLSASPERYIKKIGNSIVSQPIKGTAKRANNLEEDAALKHHLAQDPKERSENIMIVDLVRNDLSKTALKGSVKVEALCKIYTFNQVHQMISTVSSKIGSNTHPVDVIKTTFPMGSMTGAPKISAMKIVEHLEDAKRGLYSGCVGYFKPNGDFDFNVIIRSILFNQTKKYVSYSVGGAITAKSDPVKEYEECLIKAKAMRTVLER